MVIPLLPDAILMPKLCPLLRSYRSRFGFVERASVYRMRWIAWVLFLGGFVHSSSLRASDQQPLNFENDIIPILTKFGCNNSGCHGKAEGQNGFKLSVFGFDPIADYRAIVTEGRGRRIFPASPDRSLFLLKANGGLPHGGGIRVPTDRPEHETLLRWIGSGIRYGSEDDPKILSIKVSPSSLSMRMGSTQRLKVEASYSDGRTIDVTKLSMFQSNHEGLASVDESGLVVAGKVPGDVAIMANFLGHVDVFRALIPIDGESKVSVVSRRERSTHPIDRHIDRKLEQLHIVPSPPAEDAVFLRRVYLDLIGTLPTTTEARQFFSDPSEGRRGQLVERLLQRPEYADYWALKWADLLRVNRLELGRKRAYLYYRWIRDSFASNKPLDRFASELVAVEGPLSEQPAGYFYKVVKDPKAMASTISQSMLGVRIECAQCHHHPYDRWGQEDYFGFQAFFTEVAFKNTELGEAIVSSGNAKSIHPRTNTEVQPRPLGESKVFDLAVGQKRRALAQWMIARENPFFARNMANRIWAHLMGRGLVEPVDDARLTNPATHPELLDELAHFLTENAFDQKALIRWIISSQAYQRSSITNDSNQRDELNYSRYSWKRVEAEVLFDAVCQTTGVWEKFDGIPEGSRAIQLWDSHVPHYFLQTFGRPVRATACECERVSEPTVSQVLHVLNSPEIHAKLTHSGGLLQRLADRSNQDLVEELYLTFFSRMPTDEERQFAEKAFGDRGAREQKIEDLAWSMMNSLEFLFNH